MRGVSWVKRGRKKDVRNIIVKQLHYGNHYVMSLPKEWVEKIFKDKVRAGEMKVRLKEYKGYLILEKYEE